MSPLNEINIEEKETTYDVKSSYRSDMKCQNYDAEFEGIECSDGTVCIIPFGCDPGFVFHHSDPDRVIAIAQMMLSFAQMVKNNNKKTIDTSTNVC